MKTQTKSISVKKVYKTDSDTILIVTATTEGCAGRKYVSVTANEIKPIKKEDAIARVREGLEDGELWRMAVEAKQTELSLSDWVEMVIDNDGELSGFDNSLYTESIDHDGVEYIYDSLSFGCMHYSIKAITKDFNKLISLHLKDDKKSIKDAEIIISKMENDFIDAKISFITNELLQQTA